MPRPLGTVVPERTWNLSARHALCCCSLHAKWGASGTYEMQTFYELCRWWWTATRRRPSSTRCGVGCVSMWRATPRSVAVCMSKTAPAIGSLQSRQQHCRTSSTCAAKSRDQRLRCVHREQFDSREHVLHPTALSMLLQDFTGSCAVNCKDTPAPLKMALSIWWENSFNGACLAFILGTRSWLSRRQLCMHVCASMAAVPMHTACPTCMTAALRWKRP